MSRPLHVCRHEAAHAVAKRGVRVNALLRLTGLSWLFRRWTEWRDGAAPKRLNFPRFYAAVIRGDRVADVSTSAHRIRCRCLEEHAKGETALLVTYEASGVEHIR